MASAADSVESPRGIWFVETSRGFEIATASFHPTNHKRKAAQTQGGFIFLSFR